LAAKDLAEIRGSASRRDFGRREVPSRRESRPNSRLRIPARFWPPGFLLPDENPGEILAAGIFASRRESRRDSQQDRGEILAAGNFASRRESCWDPAGIPAERKNPSGQNLAAILAGFPSRSWRDPAKIPVLILQGLRRNPDQERINQNVQICLARIIINEFNILAYS